MEIEQLEQLNKIAKVIKECSLGDWELFSLNPISINNGEITIKLKRKKQELDLSKFQEVKNCE